MTNLTHSLSVLESYIELFLDERYMNTSGKQNVILTPFNKNYFKCNISEEKYYTENLVLKEMIENTLEIYRIDFLSYYQDHNYSPSVRSLHSSGFLILHDELVYYFDIYESNFRIIAHLNLGIEYKNKSFIIGFSDIYNVHRFYKSFSVMATLLENGHLLFNLQTVLNSNRIDYSFCYSKKLVDMLSEVMPATFYFSYIISFSNFDFSPLEKYKEFAYDIRNNQFQLLSMERDTQRVLNALNKIPTKSIKISENDNILLNNFKNLGSGHNVIGNWNLDENFDSISIKEVRNKLNLMIKETQSKHLINFYLLEEESSNRYKVYSNNGECQILELDDVNKYFNDSSKNIDFNTMKYFVFFTSTVKNNHNYKELLLNIGQYMQYIYAYSSSKGYKFRPFKSHNDEMILKDITFNKDELVLYSGVFLSDEIIQLSTFSD
ncbi:hypothetical protein [Streptococcus orisasini]|uniref:hypothetical protein n=1 Tax=Streptococcus orisasini TaxID=1080071 RepID=UPI00070CB3D8|nr:hypothetical protein [Streptococcus orisasini]